jgi:hypothetical protein
MRNQSNRSLENSGRISRSFIIIATITGSASADYAVGIRAIPKGYTVQVIHRGRNRTSSNLALFEEFAGTLRCQPQE